MMPDTWLTIGKVTGVHGLAGNLKVWSFADSPDTFLKGRQVRLRDEGADSGDDYTISGTSLSKKGIRLSLGGITTREASDALVGKEILMNKAQLPDLEADTWYWEDLCGLRVIDRNLGTIGTIQRLFATGADDILVVQKERDEANFENFEVLIPMNNHFVDEVDIEAGTMTTTLPEGFITQ